MDFTLILMGLALHVLVWEKLPDWDNWFNWLVARLPKPLAYLYESWHCAFCFGFWAGLGLHGLVGIYTLPQLATMPSYLGLFATPIAWFMDALVTALIMVIFSLMMKALSGPALTGHKAMMEFRQQKIAKQS